LNDEKSTKEALVDNWFHMGDIGYIDNDGFLYVSDRKKELLKFNNYQVTPSELEEIIMNEIDGVISSCIVGVLDENSGNDIIHAFVIIDDASSLTEDYVLEYVNNKVIDPKKIRGGVHFRKEFPLLASGKVNRIELKKIAENDG
jgi:acyl-coenzyme A synthetase/AMP-(fatty) acid ligase